MSVPSTNNGVASTLVAPAELAPAAPASVAPVRSGAEKPSWLSGRTATPIDGAEEPSFASGTPKRMALYIVLAIAAAALVLYVVVPAVRTALTTGSTGDASVNGRVTNVALHVLAIPAAAVDGGG